MSWDSGTEAEALEDWADGWDEEYEGRPISATAKRLKNYRNPRRGTSKVDNSNRFRCVVTGCNPKLFGPEAADSHSAETGHRTAKWPVRSKEGEQKAQKRNRTGYYSKYNVGAKSAYVREHLIK